MGTVNRTRTLDGYDRLLSGFMRMSFLLVVFEQGILLAVSDAATWLQVTRVVVAMAAMLAFWQTRKRVPTLRTRQWLGAGFGIWMVVGPALVRQTGWPFGLEIIPLGASVIGLAAGWELATGIIVLAVVVHGGLYGSGLAPLPPLFAQMAGNWAVTAMGMLFLVRQLLRTFDRASADLEASVVGLEAARDEASTLAGQLAHNVKAALDALQESLAVGPAAVEAATERLQRLLHEGRERRPPEPVLRGEEITQSLRHMRAGQTRVLFVVGCLIMCLQVVRNSMAGRTTVAWLVAAQLLAFVAVAGFHVRAPHRWRWSAHLLAGAITIISVLLLDAWHRIEPGVDIFPPVPLALGCLVMLGAVTGLRVITGLWTALFGAAACFVLEGSVWPTLVLCVVYATIGVLFATLQETLLADVVSRRKDASAAIRYRRRLIGALFHDLSNPLQAVAILVSPDGPHEGRTVPKEATELVRRMRGTLEAALGQVQPPERLPLPELFNALLSVFGARLATKRIALIPSWESGLAVTANRSLLQDTVLANLLSNAIKFSPIGGTIGIRAIRTGATVQIELQDQGPGIPDDAMAAFQAGQVAPTQTGSAGERGSGHGLFLARDYVEEMGGTLAFERPAEGGVIARVVLPAA